MAKARTLIGHMMYQLRDDKMSLKSAWSQSCDQFLIFGDPIHICGMTEDTIVKFF